MSINIYGFVSFLGCVLMLAVSALTGTKRQSYSENVRLVLRLLALWLFFEMFYYSFPGHKLQITFDLLRYLAIVFVPLSVLLTLHKFLFGTPMNIKICRLIVSAPITALVLAFTNSKHHLFFTNRFIDFENGFYFVRSQYGLLYKFAYLPYAYACVVVSFVWAIMALIRFRENQRIQAFIIMLALLVPVTGNFTYLFIDTVSKTIDYTPLLFAISGLLFYVSIQRFGFLSIVPFAQETIIEKMADAVFILDSRNNVLDTNSAARTLISDTPIHEIIGHPIARYFAETDIDPENFELNSYDKATLSTETHEGLRHFFIRDQKLHNKKNKVVGRVLLLHDISPLKEAMDSLEIEKQRAEEATKAKSRFVANISHEIRTPMTAIIGMTDMLSNADNAESQDKLVHNIQTSTKLLLQIVNDLLDLSKIEAGQLQFKSKPFIIRDIIEETEALITPLLVNRPIDFHTTMDPALPEFLIGDALRLKQVLINLLSNAAKYTEKGSIYFDVKLENLESDQATVYISVKDTGIGISERDKEKLFDLFFQVEHSNTRRFSGSGLGLAITQQLVDQMNGSIYVESELHKGSEFGLHLTMPYLKQKEAISPDEKTLYDLSKLHVLLAEDNRMNQEYMKLIFKKMACSYELASNGREAIDLALTWKFDIILMDIQMPEVDGHQAAKSIRLAEKRLDTATDGTPPPPRIPIIALTANDTEEDRMQAQLAGMDGFLSKPFTYKKIIKLIEELDIYELLET